MTVDLARQLRWLESRIGDLRLKDAWANAQQSRFPTRGRLDEILRRRGRLGAWQVIAYTDALATALDDLHSRSVAHGDVRPRNVAIDERGVVRLAIRASDRSKEKDVRYTAPELVAKGDRSREGDIYGLALVAYELLAGRPAFPADDDPDRTRASIANGVPRLRDEVAGLSAAISDSVAKATALDPDERHASAREFSLELSRAIRASDRTEVLPRARIQSVIRIRRPDAHRLAAMLPAALLLIGALAIFSGITEIRAAPVVAPNAATRSAPAPTAKAASTPAAAPTVAGPRAPSVIGLPSSEAAKLLRANGFRNDIEIIVERGATGRAGTVVRQEPAASAGYQQGQRATLYVVGPITD